MWEKISFELKCDFLSLLFVVSDKGGYPSEIQLFVVGIMRLT